MRTRRKFTAEFKAKVAIEAIKEIKTVVELSQQYELQPAQINAWKREFLAGAAQVFSKQNQLDKQQQDAEIEKEQLYAKIGQLQVQVDFLKKASS